MLRVKIKPKPKLKKQLPIYKGNVHKIEFDNWYQIDPGPHGGSFGRVTVHGNKWILLPRGFYRCREIFHAQSHRTRRMLFAHRGGAGKRIASFIYEFERRLGLKIVSRIGATNRSNCSWIEVPSWWSYNRSIKSR
jgi:hypothetical protein